MRVKVGNYFNNTIFVRNPVKTQVVNFGDNLLEILNKESDGF